MTTTLEPSKARKTTSERQYAVPRFSQFWTKKGVPERRGLWDGKSWADVQTQIDPPEPPSWDRARRARPTIWAHAAAFYNSLQQRARADSPFHSLEVQVWAGLMAALYKGDLELQEIDPMEVDPDLPAAFREGLPIDASKWPDAAGSLHGRSKITVFRSSSDPRPVAVGYAPSVVVPALWLWEEILSGRDEQTFKFYDLMSHYADLEGFKQGFRLGLRELVGGNWPDHWFQGLLAGLRNQVGDDSDEDLSEEALALLRTPAPTPFGYCWGGQVDPLKADSWQHYPLRAELPQPAGDVRFLVFVPDHGLDANLNPWLEDLAFPRSGDTRTRIGDLQVSLDGAASVVGASGEPLPLPAGHQVISLNPRAHHEHRLLREEFVHLVGEGACLDPGTPLDPVHEEIRGVVAKGHEVTSLLPLDGGFLARHPEYRESLIRSFVVRNGVALPQASATSEVSCQLPVAKQLDAVWQPRNVLLKGDGEHDLIPRADLWPNFRTSPSRHWSLYLLRIQEATELYRLNFPELDSAAQRYWDGTDSLVLVHDRPPTLAELADISDPGTTHGTLAIATASNLTEIMVDPNQNPAVAVDFGTTNTSVAFKAKTAEEPEVLQFHKRTWPLLKPKSSQRERRLPGWVFEEELHKGFFSTAIGVRERFKQDQPPCHQQIREGRIDLELLQVLLNSTDLSGLKLEWLASVHASPAARGRWEFHDQLKWGTEADGDDYRLTLRSCFMAHLLLYSTAEVLAQTGAIPADWSFTHPLSMRWVQVEDYQNDVGQTLKSLLQLIAPLVGEPRVRLLDESSAIFSGFIQSWDRVRFPRGQRVVIADMGGGSVDFAVFAEHDREPRLIRSDSLRLAGQHFFQFAEDCKEKDKDARADLDQALRIHFSKERAPHVEKQSRMGSEEFRKAFNWTLAGSLVDKTGGDPASLHSSLRRLAEERAPLRETDHIASWLSRLARAVLGHAVLLGSAPLEDENERISELEIVLAGNGWSLLPYSGYQIGDDSNLEVEATRALSILKEVWALKEDSFVGPRGVKVRALEKAVGGLPNGVYSKDLVALGALAESKGRDSSSSEPKKASSGILGADLTLTSGGDGAEEVKVPWYCSALPGISRDNLNSQVGPGGRSFFERNSISGGRWELVPKMVADGSGESKVDFQVAEQLFMYLLLDPKSEYPSGRTPGRVSDWNGEFEERAEAWRDQVNAGATSTDYDRTSLIRGLWEYYFDRRIRQHLSNK